MMTRRIDAHHHFWRVARGDYHWMPEEGVLRHDYLPEDLAPHLAAAEIDGTILVQAAQTEAETRFLLNLASGPGSFVLGVVGWAPLDDPAVEPLLEEFATTPKLVAVRPMLHDLPDPAWIQQPVVVGNLRRVATLGLRIDVLSYPEHLPHVLRAIDQVPDSAVVIDHLSKPKYGAAPYDDWRRWMAELAEHPGVHCKLSGMVTEVGQGWTVDAFRSHADHILAVFGARRVMFGSDWPVCLQAGTYAEVTRLAGELTAGLSVAESADFWGESAARFYGDLGHRARAPATIRIQRPISQ